MAENDIWKVATYFSLQGDSDNVYLWYLRETTPPGMGTGGQDLAQYFQSDLLPNLATELNDENVFNCIDHQLFFNESSLFKINSISEQKTVNIPGSEATEASLSGQCSFLVQTWADEESQNMRRRGRDFYTGFSEGQQDDGIWTDTLWAAWALVLKQDLMDGVTGPAGGEYEWVNWSETLYAARIADSDLSLIPYTEINRLRSWKRVRTQRRRQPINPCDKYYGIIAKS